MALTWGYDRRRYPIPCLDREYPIPGADRGNPHPRSRGGYPPFRSDPRSEWWGGCTLGYPPAQDWMGVPPPIMTGWGTPPLGRQQHSKHLLRGGRYASFVHTGGLSCYILYLPVFLGNYCTKNEQQLISSYFTQVRHFRPYYEVSFIYVHV